MNEFRQCIRETPCPDIMDRDDRVLWAQRDTAVNHLLTAPLHFCIAPLHRGKIQCLVAFARANTGGGSAPEPDQHRRPAQDYKLCAGRNRLFLDVTLADISKASGNHDGLVVSVAPRSVTPVCSDLKRAEISGNIRPAELVIE